MEELYPPGTVRGLLPTNAVTPQTRKALTERLKKAVATPKFFELPAFERLSQICDRLVAQDSSNRIVEIAWFIDERLADKASDGWRYDCMPPDEQMYLAGLEGVTETATLLFKKPFQDLNAAQQTEILQAIQHGTAPGEIWKRLPAKRFFEELLAETTEIFYSYPVVQEEMGYVGMADAQGWTRIGLNEREEMEPQPIGNLLKNNS
ncbi:gluconate 2-dehydrogenase subunit 3 family protein [Rufibacter soli]